MKPVGSRRVRRSSTSIAMNTIMRPAWEIHACRPCLVRETTLSCSDGVKAVARVSMPDVPDHHLDRNSARSVSPHTQRKPHCASHLLTHLDPVQMAEIADGPRGAVLCNARRFLRGTAPSIQFGRVEPHPRWPSNITSRFYRPCQK